jgi:hypothetical protein
VRLERRIMYLTSINVKARNWVFDKWGRPFPYCKEGANRFVHLARQYGYTNGRVKKVSGFRSGREHYWAVDTHTGWIYDPTQEQFLMRWDPDLESLVRDPFTRVIRKCDPQHQLYEEVPLDDDWCLGASHDEIYSMWRKYKRWQKLTGGTDAITLGEEACELRTSVKGDTYAFTSFPARFNHGMLGYECPNVTSEQFRTAVIFPTKSGGFNIGEIHQRLVFTDHGMYKPTFQHNYHLTAPDGVLLYRQKGKWVKIGPAFKAVSYHVKPGLKMLIEREEKTDE